MKIFCQCINLQTELHKRSASTTISVTAYQIQGSSMFMFN